MNKKNRPEGFRWWWFIHIRHKSHGQQIHRTELEEQQQQRDQPKSFIPAKTNLSDCQYFIKEELFWRHNSTAAQHWQSAMDSLSYFCSSPSYSRFDSHNKRRLWGGPTFVGCLLGTLLPPRPPLWPLGWRICIWSTHNREPIHKSSSPLLRMVVIHSRGLIDLFYALCDLLLPL